MIFYRYTFHEEAVMGIDGEYAKSPFPNPKLWLNQYILIKETPKGYWIAPEGFAYSKNFHKWISKTAKKKYACSSKEEALESFVKRTEVRIRILSEQLNSCKAALSLVDNLKYLAEKNRQKVG